MRQGSQLGPSQTIARPDLAPHSCRWNSAGQGVNVQSNSIDGLMPSQAARRRTQPRLGMHWRGHECNASRCLQTSTCCLPHDATGLAAFGGRGPSTSPLTSPSEPV
ncbi:hypothetical protein VAPA_1c46980 [Variovorax paradoxus B4]|uniref:Uncharacterized protein n=1 Tax=Variovorax paradoxus B4 TaxID=1246301 RepID=T1XHZ9_VARPD|nr:hypothetical protein VAPA_1c46980 [Variovorax paradoxus B4]